MYLSDPQGLLSFYPESTLSSLDFLAEVKNTNLACGQTGSHHTDRRRQLSLLLHVITWRKLLCLGATWIQSAHTSASPTSHQGIDAGRFHRKAWAMAALTTDQAALPYCNGWLAGLIPLNTSACVRVAWLVNTSLYHPNSQKISVTNSLKQVLNETVRQRLATWVHQPSLQL